MTLLEETSLEQLIVRKKILEWIISESEDDPRIDEPKRQLRIINDEIKRREEPQDLVVGLNTLKMEAKRLK